MKTALEIFTGFGFPFFAIVFYLIKFSKLEAAVYKMGLVNTVTLALWFSSILTILFWGVSGIHYLAFFYLILIAPILSIGFCYYIWINRKELVGYKFVLITSLFNFGFFLFLIFGSIFQP